MKKKILQAAEQTSLFCRLNTHKKKDIPIRTSEMSLLLYLCKAENAQTPMAIATAFQVTKSMATNLITALCKKGYLLRQPSPLDRRSVLVLPTEKARALVAETSDAYYHSMLLLREKMGREDFSAFLTLLKSANAILLGEKNTP